jgi:argininosuccinate synthase
MNRIVLGFTGDPETSAAIPWLKERYGAEIIAVTVDLGQGGDLEEVRDRALAAGAARAHVLDGRDEFARDFILPSLQADALYDERYPLIDALGRSLVARKLVEIADIELATALAHGGHRTGSEPALLEIAIRAVRPAVTLIAPAAEWGMSPAQLFEYAAAHGVSVPPRRTHVSNANVWGRAIPCGVVDDSWRDAPDDVYTLTKSGGECPNEPAYVEIAFDRGVPAAINGISMPLIDLIGSLVTIAGAHGVGRLDLVESSPNGQKVRTLYEVPAAVVLHAAHRELQKLVAGRDVDRFSRFVRGHYGDLIRSGQWFSPLRSALDAYVQHVQEQVSGVVRLKLFKGACRTVGRKSSQNGAKTTIDGRQSAVGA